MGIVTPEQAERIAERIVSHLMDCDGELGYALSVYSPQGLSLEWRRAEVAADIRAALLEEPESTPDRTTGPTRDSRC